MWRNILVKMECNEEYCDGCSGRNWNLLTDEYCYIFRESDGSPKLLVQDGAEFKRCDECLLRDSGIAAKYNTIHEALAAGKERLQDNSNE